jgi:hypothetical protein
MAILPLFLVKEETVNLRMRNMAKKQLNSSLVFGDLLFKFGSDIAIIQYPNIS